MWDPAAWRQCGPQLASYRKAEKYTLYLEPLAPWESLPQALTRANTAADRREHDMYVHEEEGSRGDACQGQHAGGSKLPGSCRGALHDNNTDAGHAQTGAGTAAAGVPSLVGAAGKGGGEGSSLPGAEPAAARQAAKGEWYTMQGRQQQQAPLGLRLALWICDKGALRPLAGMLCKWLPVAKGSLVTDHCPSCPIKCHVAVLSPTPSCACGWQC
jgi:hypothetical protein